MKIIEMTESEQPGICTRCNHITINTRNSIGECYQCHNLGTAERKAARRLVLDSLPRCDVEKCQRRGTWIYAGAMLCGWHLRNAQRKMARHGAIGFLAMANGITTDQMIDLAS